jgi:hypothetical protein
LAQRGRTLTRKGGENRHGGEEEGGEEGGEEEIASFSVVER